MIREVKIALGMLSVLGSVTGGVLGYRAMNSTPAPETPAEDTTVKQPGQPNLLAGLTSDNAPSTKLLSATEGNAPTPGKAAPPASNPWGNPPADPPAFKNPATAEKTESSPFSFRGANPAPPAADGTAGTPWSRGTAAETKPKETFPSADKTPEKPAETAAELPFRAPRTVETPAAAESRPAVERANPLSSVAREPASPIAERPIRPQGDLVRLPNNSAPANRTFAPSNSSTAPSISQPLNRSTNPTFSGSPSNSLGTTSSTTPRTIVPSKVTAPQIAGGTVINSNNPCCSPPVRVVCPPNPCAPTTVIPNNLTPRPALPRNGLSATPSETNTPARAASPEGSGSSTASSQYVYVVLPEDNYESISETVYGSRDYELALQEYNRRFHSLHGNLIVGEEIFTPPATVLSKQFPQLLAKRSAPSIGSLATAAASPKLIPAGSPDYSVTPIVYTNSVTPLGGKIYTVADGETLKRVARQELGDEPRRREIYDLNQSVLRDPLGLILPGTELVLPAD